jgi:MiaB-like tRNA modifying enzyme
MARIYIKSFGCSVNQSDAEVLAGILLKGGLNIVNSEEDAALIIVNTCCVKRPTEIKIMKYLDELKKLKKPVIVTGCIAQAMPEKVKEFSLLGTFQLHNIITVVEETLSGNIVHLVVKEKSPRLALPKIRKNDVIEIIPICSGCLGNPCSYCIVPQARGELVSYETEEILKHAKEALAEGAKEIWLTAQDTGCYGKERNDSLINLLKEVLSIKHKFYLRLGMINPNHAIEMLDELVKLYHHPNMFKFLHIPVQSGNDEILKKMKRKYSVEDFKTIVKRFKKALPELTISTDIICGFPTETKEQFQDSVKLVQELRPDVLNISRFWPRKGTEAEKMPQFTSAETKERSRHLTSVFDYISFENNKRWMGWIGEAIVDDHGKNNTFIARNFAYKQIILESSKDLFGELAQVQIDAITKYDLRGQIL